VARWGEVEGVLRGICSRSSGVPCVTLRTAPLALSTFLRAAWCQWGGHLGELTDARLAEEGLEEPLEGEPAFLDVDRAEDLGRKGDTDGICGSAQALLDEGDHGVQARVALQHRPRLAAGGHLQRTTVSGVTHRL